MKKKLAALALVALGAGAAPLAPPSAEAFLCPPRCIVSGAVSGTTIVPDLNNFDVRLDFTAIDLRANTPQVRQGSLRFVVALTPASLGLSQGNGLAYVDYDLNPLDYDAVYAVSATRAGGETGSIMLRGGTVQPAATRALNVETGYTRSMTGLTTFAGTAAELQDEAPLVESLTVMANDVDGVNSTAVLEAGATYQIAVSGTFDYDFDDPGDQLADGECSFSSIVAPNSLDGLLDTAEATTTVPLPDWRRDRFFLFEQRLDANQQLGSDLFDPDPTDDAVDLYVDGRDVAWVPTDGSSAAGCNESGHTYTASFTPTGTRQVNFRIFDVQYGDNGCSSSNPGCGKDRLQVSVRKIADRPVAVSPPRHHETVLVHSANSTPQPSTTLVAGKTYTVTARGMFKYVGFFGNHAFADAECSRAAGAGSGTYTRNRFVQAGQDPLDIYVNGAAVDWEPVGAVVAPGSPPSTWGCSPTHTYRTTITPAVTGPATFHLYDAAAYGDNAGTLSIEIVET